MISLPLSTQLIMLTLCLWLFCSLLSLRLLLQILVYDFLQLLYFCFLSHSLSLALKFLSLIPSPSIVYPCFIISTICYDLYNDNCRICLSTPDFSLCSVLHLFLPNTSFRKSSFHLKVKMTKTQLLKKTLILPCIKLHLPIAQK